MNNNVITSNFHRYSSPIYIYIHIVFISSFCWMKECARWRSADIVTRSVSLPDLLRPIFELDRWKNGVEIAYVGFYVESFYKYLGRWVCIHDRVLGLLSIKGEGGSTKPDELFLPNNEKSKEGGKVD